MEWGTRMTDRKEVIEGPVELLANSTLQEVLTARIGFISTSPKMLEIIDSKIEKCLTEVVDEAFGRWSDFSKQSTEALKAALPGSIGNVIDLGRYNDMIQQRLREKFASSGIANDMIAKAETALSEAMKEDLLPPVIMMSTLLEAFIENHAERAREYGWECPDFRLVESESSLTSEYQHFYFDEKKEERSRYSSSERSQYQLANSLDMRAIEGANIEGNQVYEVYSAKIDDKFVQRIISTGQLYSKWEKMVFALYYGQSKICINCDPDDYCYPGYD